MPSSPRGTVTTTAWHNRAENRNRTGSFADRMGLGSLNSKEAAGPNAVLRNGQWVPFHIASPDKRPDLTGMVDPLDDKPDLRFAPDHEVEAWIRNNYGYFAAFLDNPEVRNVLFSAARNDWGEGEMKGALYATNWWKNTDAAQRTWQRLVAEDPAEARAQVDREAANIQNKARTLGLPMAAGEISRLAHQVVVNGWTSDQYVDALISQVNWNTLEGGDLTAYRDNVKAIGGQYLVGVSDSTAQNYAMRIASGELTQEGVASIMRKQAKARFGYLSEEIDQGVSVRDYFQPIRDTIARELEMAPEAIDMMDPRWLSMMEKTGEDGKLRAANTNEVMLSARQQSEWKGTRGAQEMVANMSSLIAQTFGRSSV